MAEVASPIGPVLHRCLERIHQPKDPGNTPIAVDMAVENNAGTVVGIDVDGSTDVSPQH